MSVVTVAVAVHGALAVGAALRVEGRCDHARLGAEAAHHVGDHVVVADEDDAPSPISAARWRLPRCQARRASGAASAQATPAAAPAPPRRRRCGRPPAAGRRRSRSTAPRQVEQEGEPAAPQADAPPRALVVVEPHDVGGLPFQVPAARSRLLSACYLHQRVRPGIRGAGIQRSQPVSHVGRGASARWCGDGARDDTPPRTGSTAAPSAATWPARR